MPPDVVRGMSLFGQGGLPTGRGARGSGRDRRIWKVPIRILMLWPRQNQDQEEMAIGVDYVSFAQAGVEAAKTCVTIHICIVDQGHLLPMC